MKARAWSNGSPGATGSGYGLVISLADRDRYLDPAIDAVVIRLGKRHDVNVRLSPSFWQNCPEFRSAELGRWLLENGYAPWAKGKPPAFEMELNPDGSLSVKTWSGDRAQP